MSRVLAIAFLVLSAIVLALHLAEAERHPAYRRFSACSGFVALGLAVSVVV